MEMDISEENSTTTTTTTTTITRATSNDLKYVPYYIGNVRLDDVLSKLVKSYEKRQLYKDIDMRILHISHSQHLYKNLFTQLNGVIRKLNDKYFNYDDTLLKKIGNNENKSNVATATTFGVSNAEFYQQREIMARLERRINGELSDNLYDDLRMLTNIATIKELHKKKQAKKEQQQEMEEGVQIGQQEQQQEMEHQQQQQINEYPKRFKYFSGNELIDYAILGPNETRVEGSVLDGALWTTAASATRSLLGSIFDSKVLSTHTLTGKPSPAFHGRERPPKMKLDPKITADIIYCVRSRFINSEREIRSAITTKCADTSKKIKRRLVKKRTPMNLCIKIKDE